MSSAGLGRKFVSGFSLIELMVVMAIVAIIAAVAIPSYNAYLVRGNQSAAEAMLMDIAQRQQQYLLDNRSYAPDLTTLNYVASGDVTSYYGFATAGAGTGFTATATPVSGTIQASADTLQIDQAGTKSPASDW